MKNDPDRIYNFSRRQNIITEVEKSRQVRMNNTDSCLVRILYFESSQFEYLIQSY